VDSAPTAVVRERECNTTVLVALTFQDRVPAASASRIALFPGAWNPPTVAHLAIARAALGHVQEVVWLLPREFPHKGFEGATFDQRLDMLRRTTESESRFSVAVAEGGLYFEMADEARTCFGLGPEISLLCGRDAAERIAAWDYGRAGVFDAMVEQYPLLVAGRAGDYRPHARHASRVVALTVNFDDVSSTELRGLMARGLPWRHLVPPSIAEIAAAIYT
jgi:nicotinic acid mononucleotide adenylyltransferase